MERSFAHEDVQNLSESQLEFVLSEQAETLRHTQEQGQKLFRLLIAASALLIGLAGTDIYAAIINSSVLSQFLSSDVIFQNGVTRSAPNVIDTSMDVVVTLAIVSVGLLYEAAMTTIWIMKTDSTFPTARRKDTNSKQKSQTEENLLMEWVLENDIRVTEALIKLNRCYTSVWLGTGVGLLAGSLFAVSAIGWLPLIGFLHLTVLLVVPAGVIYYGKGPFRTVVNGDTDELRGRAKEAMDQWVDSWEYVGPSAAMKIGLFLIFSTIWQDSFDTVIYWLQFP